MKFISTSKRTKKFHNITVLYRLTIHNLHNLQLIFEENGMPEGRGHYKFESGDEYMGEFHLGLQHGKGVYRYGKNGTELTADWERGKVGG